MTHPFRRHRAAAPLSLHTRLSLILTALTASLLLALAGCWLKATNNSIGEEIEAANRVAGQWLHVVARQAQQGEQSAARALLLEQLTAIGRIRANDLEVLDSDSGTRLYQSPPSTYKHGRNAPTLFRSLVEPAFSTQEIAAGQLTLRLHPDASRATLDAWDDLCAMTGWALAALLLLFLGTRYALDRSLRPLQQIMAALDRTGPGCFDTRLPVYADADLGRLSRAFNGMAARLADAVNQNVQLEDQQHADRQLQQRLEAQRQAIARELHDELAQGITAVRALAGAIAQRTGEQPALFSHAQSIVAVAGQMQDGIRHILQRLRPLAQSSAKGDALTIDRLLRRHLADWQQQQPHIEVQTKLDLGEAALGSEVAVAVLRIVQEGLTNIAKHAAASQVQLQLHRQEQRLYLRLSDDGRGLDQPRDKTDTCASGCGLGLLGMHERVGLLGGRLQLDNRPGGGVCLQVWLPDTAATSHQEL